MKNKTRVRFAPSPTGPLHIGGVRTALYNYLFAKATGGEFILRIEDTDQKRYVEGAEDYIMQSLRWAGMLWDEGPGHSSAFGPYRQSERSAIYRTYVQKLVESGKAYLAFDSPEDLDEMRKNAEAQGQTGRYDATTRMDMTNSLSLSQDEVRQRIENNQKHVVRLRVEPGAEVSFEDIVRGRVKFSTDELDDKVLMKADGLPTYHFANVVDDHLMEISHVIRGEEWLSSTPHHVLLYEALGWSDSMPQFAHLPLIMKPVGQGKLSKRDGAKFGIPVFPLRWEGKDESFDGFREFGFLPEGMINFLALLGWNPGDDQEILSMEELQQSFSLERVVKSGARFDFEKAKWFNEQYIKKAEAQTIEKLFYTRHPEWDQDRKPDLGEVLPVIQDRLVLLTDVLKESKYFYEAPTEYDQKALRKKWKDNTEAWYHELIGYLDGYDWKGDIEQTVKTWITNNELGMGQVFPILRLALCGVMSGPSVFEIMRLVGKEETLHRLRKGMEEFVQRATPPE